MLLSWTPWLHRCAPVKTTGGQGGGGQGDGWEGEGAGGGGLMVERGARGNAGTWGGCLGGDGRRGEVDGWEGKVGGKGGRVRQEERVDG